MLEQFPNVAVLAPVQGAALMNKSSLVAALYARTEQDEALKPGTYMGCGSHCQNLSRMQQTLAKLAQKWQSPLSYASKADVLATRASPECGSTRMRRPLANCPSKRRVLPDQTQKAGVSPKTGPGRTAAVSTGEDGALNAVIEPGRPGRTGLWYGTERCVLGGPPVAGPGGSTHCQSMARMRHPLPEVTEDAAFNARTVLECSTPCKTRFGTWYSLPGQAQDATPRDPAEAPVLPGDHALYPDRTQDCALYPSPTQDLVLYPDPAQDLVLYPDPAQDLVLYPDPAQDLVLYPDPAQDLVLYPDPAQDLVLYPDPAQDLVLYPDSVQDHALYSNSD
ncbi:hypothetical protein NDU88_001603 [Pleurodeles waltl]|uniref:Uncharacterized protein n=1 Tax=Pleurodeles waltl TaxID=8319 RepID=A0AAV7SAC1_PLEWA|nr:hypothetical protein NDU88_001603 [Pleurodeles waltl]